MSLETLPEGMGDAFKEFMDDLTKQGIVASVGLYGSWCRGVATPSSDVDLLVLDMRNLEYEYGEFVDYEGLRMDVRRVPVGWVDRVVNPTIDHEVMESTTLYDPQNILMRGKEWLSNVYWRPSRIRIRAEEELSGLNRYVSRASSSVEYEDLESAVMYVRLSVEAVARAVCELARMPPWNTSLISRFYRSCYELGVEKLYDVCMELAALKDVNRRRANEALKLFREAWELFSGYVEENRETVESMDRRVRAAVEYASSSCFGEGSALRAGEMIQVEEYEEAVYYLMRNTAKVVEAHAWIASEKLGVALNYPHIMTVLRNSGPEFETLYENALKIFSAEEPAGDKVREDLKTLTNLSRYIKANENELLEKGLTLIRDSDKG